MAAIIFRYMRGKVTVGIPMFQAEAYIKRALLSVLNQDYRNFDVVVVDDGSTDGSSAIVRNVQAEHLLGDSVRLIQLAANGGVGNARNRIIDEADGDFLFFLDSDDFISPNALSLLVGEADHNDAQLAIASYEKHDVEGTCSSMVYGNSCFTRHGELADYAFSHYGKFQSSVCNILYRLDFLRFTGVRFNTADYWEDMSFLYELLPYVSRAALLSDITYFYYCRNGSLSHYQKRDFIPKSEVQHNIDTIHRIQESCRRILPEAYAGNVFFNLQMNCLYIVIDIVVKRKAISPAFDTGELREAVRHPLSFGQIMRLRRKRFPNALLSVLSHLPRWVFMTVVMAFRKMI